jgi:TM2 domain-containing membrane protein YozV
MVLAFTGAIAPVSGLHKFYLGQPGWGIAYLLLGWTPIPRVVSVLEGIWYLIQGDEAFDRTFNGAQNLPEASAPPLKIAVQQAVERGVTIDVNQAKVEDWLQLPGFSAQRAKYLVELGRGGVQFHCLEDLAAALDISVREIQPWEPLLQFAYYEPEAFNTIVRLNPNVATQQSLMALPGVTQGLAEEIIHQRILHGPYFSLIDFQQRLQLSGSLTGELMHYLTFR